MCRQREDRRRGLAYSGSRWKVDAFAGKDRWNEKLEGMYCCRNELTLPAYLQQTKGYAFDVYVVLVTSLALLAI